MGYNAHGDGDIVLKEGVKAEVLADIIDTLKEVFDEVEEDDSANTKAARLFVEHYHDHYHDDDTKECLDTFSPYVASGCITFSGEDDCLWRFRFDEKDGKWIEENGAVVYTDNEDRDIIREALMSMLCDRPDMTEAILKAGVAMDLDIPAYSIRYIYVYNLKWDTVNRGEGCLSPEEMNAPKRLLIKYEDLGPITPFDSENASLIREHLRRYEYYHSSTVAQTLYAFDFDYRMFGTEEEAKEWLDAQEKDE